MIRNKPPRLSASGPTRRPPSATTPAIVDGLFADPCWSDEADTVLIELVDQLHDTSDVDDDLWARLSRGHQPEQLLDLLLLCGWYHAISFAARGARVGGEPGAPRFADFLP